MAPCPQLANRRGQWWGNAAVGALLVMSGWQGSRWLPGCRGGDGEPGVQVGFGDSGPPGGFGRGRGLSCTRA